MAQYVHDCWVNFFEESNPHLIPNFEGWHKEDKVELLDQAPVIIVNSNLQNYIEYGFNVIDEQITKEIYRKSYLRNGVVGKREVIDYCFITSDKNRSMVVQLDDNKRVFKKSRLIPR